MNIPKNYHMGNYLLW